MLAWRQARAPGAARGILRAPPRCCPAGSHTWGLVCGVQAQGLMERQVTHGPLLLRSRCPGGSGLADATWLMELLNLFPVAFAGRCFSSTFLS